MASAVLAREPQDHLPGRPLIARDLVEVRGVPLLRMPVRALIYLFRSYSGGVA